MPKRNLRVLKWLGTVPAVATCTHCNREFKIPLQAAKRVSGAQENLKLQFAEHECSNDKAPGTADGDSGRTTP